MKKGLTITFDKAKNKQPWEVKYIGIHQQLSNFDFGTGKIGILKCANCGCIHWKDFEEE